MVSSEIGDHTLISSRTLDPYYDHVFNPEGSSLPQATVNQVEVWSISLQEQRIFLTSHIYSLGGKKSHKAIILVFLGVSLLGNYATSIITNYHL